MNESAGWYQLRAELLLGPACETVFKQKGEAHGVVEGNLSGGSF